MIRIVELAPDLAPGWSNYVAEAPAATIAHELNWSRVMSDGLGHRPLYRLAIDDDRVVGVLPMVLIKTWWQTRYLISLPWIDYGGVLADNGEVEAMLYEEARRLTKEMKAKFAEFRTATAGAFNLALLKNKVTFLLKLADDPDEIWKGFDAKLRNQIRKAEKSDLETAFAGIEGLPEFYKVFAYNMRDLGTPVWGYGFFKSILESFPETARIILVKKGNLTIASGLVLRFKDRLYVPSASAYRSFLKYCPNHALYWAVIKKGCEEGHKLFDFGRSAIDSSTYKFKIQWVPQPTQLTWQYYLWRIGEIPAINPHNPKYRLFINMWQRLPLPIANFLGPKLIKNFP